jgi:enoyl-[acyl-carrier protein] reductase I
MEPQTIIARRIARELKSGMLVNLGIGIPTLVANYVPAGMHVFFQSENGLIGTGAPAEEGLAHPTLTDAGGRAVTALPGASTFDSAMSFGLIRGRHLDLTVLGGLQVDQEGHQLDDPGQNGAGNGRSNGFGDRGQARHRGHAAHRQRCREDCEEVHSAHHLSSINRLSRHRNGGHCIFGWSRKFARNRSWDLGFSGRVVYGSRSRDPQKRTRDDIIGETLEQPESTGGSQSARTKPEVSMIPTVKAKLLEGKKGLIVGIANENSIAWGCAKAFRAFGAELAVTYLNDKAKKYVEPLARELEAPIMMPLDVNVPGQMEAVFERIAGDWDGLDFLVHSIAFSPKEALQGRVTDVQRDGFLTTMEVSCWTFIRMAHLAEPLMRRGGTLFTMTYYGSQMVVKNYNIMGVAKAALESAVRYMAAELGPKGIRVHAISPGPLATRAASGIPEFDVLLDKAKEKAPARSLVSIEDVGVATAFLAHDAARLITGETLYVDGGYHIID